MMNQSIIALVVTAPVAFATAEGAVVHLSHESVAFQDEASKLAKVNEAFDALRAALTELPPILSDALEASVQEEELQRKKAEEKGGTDWRCESELRRAKDRSADRRKAASTLVQRAENKWAAAKGAARDLPADKLPWGSAPADAKAVNDAILRVRKLYNDINSAQSSIGPKRIASIWKGAQDYASKQPSKLPSVKAEDIVHSNIVVPCINTTVAMRPGK